MLATEQPQLSQAPLLRYVPYVLAESREFVHDGNCSADTMMRIERGSRSANFKAAEVVGPKPEMWWLLCGWA